MKHILLALILCGVSVPLCGEPAQHILLLRRDAVLTESAMADELFLSQYKHSCISDVEKFISENLMSDSYVELYGKQGAEEGAAAYRKAVRELTAAAETYYRRSMEYVSDCILSVEHPYETELLEACRSLLRRSILQDLSNLSHSLALWIPHSYNTWCGPHYKESCMPSVQLTETPFEKSLRHFMKDTNSSFYYNEVIVAMRRKQLEEMQRVMLDIMEQLGEDTEFLTGYYGSPTTPKQVQLFLAAEKAWDAYYEAIAAAHSPVSNSVLTGTGTAELVLNFQKALLSSHMSMLVELLNLRSVTFSD